MKQTLYKTPFTAGERIFIGCASSAEVQPAASPPAQRVHR